MLTLNEIRNVNFRKANFGGYRAEDVEAFIDEVQLSYDTLLRENAELVKKLEVLAAKLEEYQNEEDSIRNALMNAQKVGDASLRDAKHKAEIILKDATIKAEKIVANAQAEILSERDIIERMQRDITEFKTKLLRIYREHLTLINSLPTEDIMRPDTKSAVESVQMLDRKASEPDYDTRQTQQLPNERMPQLVSDPEQPFGTDRSGFSAPAETKNTSSSQGAAVGQPVMPANGGIEFGQASAAPVSPRNASQRKGGYTVDIGDNAPSVQPVPAFGEPAVQSFDAPSDEAEGMGTPASLFKRRAGRN